MEITTRVLNMTLTDENQKHIDAKCAALEKRFNDAVRLSLEIQRDRHHRKGDVIAMRATLRVRNGESNVIHGESAESTFVRSLDEVLDALAKQLERITKHPRTRATK